MTITLKLYDDSLKRDDIRSYYYDATLLIPRVSWYKSLLGMPSIEIQVAPA